jgi:hypothetical protein
MKVPPKKSCHKIQWLQFANTNIARLQSWLGIRGTHLKSSIQDIVDKVAPKKKALMGLRADSFECDFTRLIRGL